MPFVDIYPIRAPLSHNQEFLCPFDRGEAEGAFGDRHVLVAGWRISGRIDLDALRRALADVVARHEALRTSILRGEGPHAQLVHPPTMPPLVVRTLTPAPGESRDGRAERLLNEVDATPFSPSHQPQLRAIVGRFDDTDAVLVLATHHTATDAWSMRLIMEDLSARYARHSGHPVPDDPPPPTYREFAAEQLRGLESEPVRAARAYWRRKLRGAEILGLPTDSPRPPGVPNAYAAHRFLVEAGLTASVLGYARATRSTPFVVLFAAYTVLLHNRTGAWDVTIPTFLAGRSDERFQRTVGMFFSFVPLRTDLTGCDTLREAVERTRRTCLEAYHHELPFGLIAAEAPELTRQFADDNRTVVTFELLQSGFGDADPPAGGLHATEIRRRLLSQEDSSHIPDGGLWAMDLLPSGEMVGSLKYNRNLVDVGTAAGLVDDYRRVLRAVVTTPDGPLKQI
ncbi:condensation domain-containing protein [Micromonospora sp. NPDC051543]|uniref:condensation domain-containing protein n=1 Tax=Micromonospora sp. NPDC051543 TaxID=3364287 RepID=UPI003799BF28